MSELKQSTVLTLNGVDAFVEASGFQWPEGGPITVEFWTKVNTDDVGDGSVFSIGGANFPHRIQAHVPWGDGLLDWDYGSYDGGRLVSDFAPYLNRWTHVALISSGNGGGFRDIFLNGALVATIHAADGPDIPLSGLTIGRWGPLFHKGKIADFRVWKRTRGGHEIARDMNRRLVGDEAGLAGYWPLDEGEGDQAKDLCGGNHGVVHGAVWSTSTELILQPAAPSTVTEVKALHCWGHPDHGEVPALNLNSNTVTIEAWIKPSGLHRDWDGIFYCRSASTRAGLNVMANNEIRYNWNDSTWSWSSGLIAPIGVWSHVALVIEPSRATLYLNGVSRVNAVPHDLEQFDAPSQIGRDTFQDDAFRRYFRGQIAEVRVWSRSCTPDEIRVNGHRRMTGCEPGLVGYWPLTERQGQQALDRARGGSATIVGSSWTDALDLAVELAPMSPTRPSIPARETPVLALGDGHSAVLPGVRELLFDRSFTVECWVKLADLAGERTILGTASGGPRQGLHLALRDGRVHCGFVDADTTGGAPMSADRWAHVAFSYDRERGVQRVYLDGALSGIGGARPSWVGGDEVLLGRAGEGSDLRGRITELRIWDHARGEDLLAEGLQRRATGREDGLCAYFPLDEGEGLALRERLEGRTAALDGAAWAVDSLELVPAAKVGSVLCLHPNAYAGLPDVSPILRDRSFTVEC
ncbi:MAG: LamG domain-containing protein [Nannocystaceae bacterium]